MAVQYATQERVVYYQHSTQNKSFTDMSEYLKSKGIKHHEFMLLLLDPDLARINPRDPNLPQQMKVKVLRECMYNPWYFFREICRIPDDGNMNGVPFILHRGNMAMLFCLMLNLNTSVILPRQTGKTQSALAWYMYLFNFGTTNAEMSFLNKKFEDSKLNLNRMKAIRDLLPSYLKMDQVFDINGQKLKGRNAAETITHPINGNRVRTVPSARDIASAASLMRGRTTSIIYIDEWAFIKHNKIIYLNMVPAWNTAARNARTNNKPYGMLITTTPGMLTTDEGMYAFGMREMATKFSEHWYDLTYGQIMDIINSNSNSNYVHIEYTYQQLGYSEEWFRDLCINMQKNWPEIRREVLLEWSAATENSPFSKEDLDTIRGLLKAPIHSFMLFNKYTIYVYERILQNKYPPIMGVDVSGGYMRDSSAITIIDSFSTRVTAEFNCNYISTMDLAAVIHELVSRWMPNCIVNIERNGGFGASVISKLLTTSIKSNLFFSIKDKVIEERVMDGHIQKKTQKMKIYGSDSTKSDRDALMEILRERVSYHKDKIISKTIYDELCGLEMKKNGKIEHSTNTHDDQVFSWLWALHVWYNAGDLANQWGIQKQVLRTDADLEEAIYEIQDPRTNVMKDLEIVGDEVNEIISEQVHVLEDAPGKMMYREWLAKVKAEDDAAMAKILSTPQGRRAYEEKYHTVLDDSQFDGGATTSIPIELFMRFNSDTTIHGDEVDQGNLASVWRTL